MSIYIPPLKDITFTTPKNPLNERQNYAAIYQDKRLSITLKKVYLPFGAEDYNKKYILNIEIPQSKTNNYHYNIYSAISQFESELRNSDNFPSHMRIERLTYVPNMRESEKGYIVRSYLNNPDIYTYNDGIFNDSKTTLSIGDLVNTVCNIRLELGILWTNETSYGIVWYARDIEVLYSKS